MPLVSGAAAGLEADFIQDLLHRDLATEGIEVHACHDLVQGFLLRLQASALSEVKNRTPHFAPHERRAADATSDTSRTGSFVSIR
jgi:hypothetical protein